MHQTQISTKGKIVFLGDMGVGKTAIINSFHKKKIDEAPTIGATSNLCQVILPDKRISLNVWDTAGQEEFLCVLPMYVHGAQIAVFVFDFNNKDSFQHLEFWFKFIEEKIDIPHIVVVGNKSDLSYNISQNEAEEYCRIKNFPLFITSAKTRNGIEILFTHLAKTVDSLNPEICFLYDSSEINKKSYCC